MIVNLQLDVNYCADCPFITEVQEQGLNGYACKMLLRDGKGYGAIINSVYDFHKDCPFTKKTQEDNKNE